MTHGYASNPFSHFMLYKSLAANFRVIFFAQGSWGGNSKREDVQDAFETAEKAEAAILSWLEAFFEAIDHLLPPKFYLYGHSNGGYQSGLYASYHPERILKLFLNSPSGTMGIQPVEAYDPYNVRVTDRVNQVPSREAVEKAIHDRENNVQTFAHLP